MSVFRFFFNTIKRLFYENLSCPISLALCAVNLKHNNQKTNTIKENSSLHSFPLIAFFNDPSSISD